VKVCPCGYSFTGHDFEVADGLRPDLSGNCDGTFGGTPADPRTAAATLSAVAAAAGYWPARRAAQIDPREALRST